MEYSKNLNCLRNEIKIIKPSGVITRYVNSLVSSELIYWQDIQLKTFKVARTL